jgi:hypothetical protein
MNDGLKNRFEHYFKYRWAKNRNIAITDEDGIKMIGQLPETEQNRLIMNSLHR